MKIAACLLLATSPIWAAARIDGELKRWRPITLTIDSTAQEMTVEFIHPPCGKKYVIPGYRTPQGKWRVHFSPDHAGHWRYAESSQGAKRTLRIREADRSDPGPVILAAGGYLKFAGTDKHFLENSAPLDEWLTHDLSANGVNSVVVKAADADRFEYLQQQGILIRFALGPDDDIRGLCARFSHLSTLVWSVESDQVADVVRAHDPYRRPILRSIPARSGTVWSQLMSGAGGVWHTANVELALRFFQRHLPFWAMRPEESIGGEKVLALGEELKAVYLPEGAAASLKLGTGRYGVRWYNPRTGGMLRDGDVATVEGPGIRPIGAPPDSGDWVALVRRLTP